MCCCQRAMSLFIGSAPRLAERHRLRCRLPSRHHAHDALLAPNSSPGVGRISLSCLPAGVPTSMRVCARRLSATWLSAGRLEPTAWCQLVFEGERSQPCCTLHRALQRVRRVPRCPIAREVRPPAGVVVRPENSRTPQGGHSLHPLTASCELVGC